MWACVAHEQLWIVALRSLEEHDCGEEHECMYPLPTVGNVVIVVRWCEQCSAFVPLHRR